ncbi:MAG: C10 family peptidase [Holosporaceae bacterium]|nr:C10 family peptidase [Holosporaceae bacterium]
MKKAGKVLILVLFILFSLTCKEGLATFIPELQARVVVQNWLEMGVKKSSIFSGTEISEVMYFHGGIFGEPGYYIVLLAPDGWVAVPADDAFEPIMAFGEGIFTREEYVNSPLVSLIHVDIPQESQQILRTQKSATPARQNNVQNSARAGRWSYLNTLPVANNSRLKAQASAVVPSIDMLDIVVPPLLGSNTWGQSMLGGVPYFNFYTDWNTNTYYDAGCTAVATAQLMSIFKYPTLPIFSTQPSYPITVDKISKKVPLRGGSVGNEHWNPSLLGRYDWDLLPPEITVGVHDVGLSADGKSGSLNDRIRNEIASLLYDTGVLLESAYTLSDDTGANIRKIPKILKENFGYQNAIWSPMPYRRDILDETINPNLDYGIPVLITGRMLKVNPQNPNYFIDTGDNHIFAIDGYGYQKYYGDSDRTQYHHFNMGWGNHSYTRGIWYDLTYHPWSMDEGFSEAINYLTISEDAVTTNFFQFVFNVMSDDTGKELYSERS